MNSGESRPVCDVLLISEYAKQSGAPTGFLASDFVDFLKERVTGNVWFFHIPGRYSPGGLRMKRILNLCGLHLATPFVLLIAKMRSLVAGRRLAVIATTSPPLIHWTTQLFAACFFIPVLTWYQDAHPEIEGRLFEKRGLGLLASLLRAIDRVVMRIPATTVTLDDGMRLALLKRSRHIRKAVSIPPWATYLEPPSPLRTPGKNTVFRILYAGNYGKAHDMSPFVARLKNEDKNVLDKMEFIFVGMNSESSNAISQLFAPLPVKKQFLPRFAQISELLKLMREVDFGLVSLNPEFEGILCPSKAFTYLSQGTPVLYTGPENSLSWEICEKGWGCRDDVFLGVLRGKVADFPFAAQQGHVYPNPRSVSLDALLSTLVQIAH